MTDYEIVARPQVDTLGEGPMWSVHAQRLYWVDIFGQALNALDMATGAVHRWAMPERIGWVVERMGRPGLIAGFRSGVVELTLDSFEVGPLDVRPLVTPEPDRPRNRLNDAKVDATGRLWFGSKDDADQAATGALYRMDGALDLSRMDDGYRVTNGPAFSPDGRFLYHTDSGLGLVYRFALLPDGALGPRETFISFEPDWGAPDGMTTDSEGCLWIAHWGGGRISRFDPDGQWLRSIHLPAQNITSCAFGGADLARLYVTSAGIDSPGGAADGALFVIDPGVCGFAPTPFAG